jgi:hypothetical protein
VRAVTTDATLPRRKSGRIVTDEGARQVNALLGQLAARVKHQPAFKTPEDGMVRLGRRDRASYVWFLRRPDDFTPPAPVSGGGLRNHGIGVDRQDGAYEVRAWAHGAPGVHDVSLHTHTLTLEMLETAAKLVGIPLEDPEPELKTWVHGSRFGRGHADLDKHLAEDHGFHGDYLDSLSDGGLHGLHDGEHNTTWAYAADLSHEKCEILALDVRPSQHLRGTHPDKCSGCMEYLRGDKG